MKLDELVDRLITEFPVTPHHVQRTESTAEIRYTPIDELELNPEFQWCSMKISYDPWPQYTLEFTDTEIYPQYSMFYGPYRDFFADRAFRSNFSIERLPWNTRYVLARLSYIKNEDNFLKVLAKIFLQWEKIEEEEVCIAAEFARIRGYSRAKIQEFRERILRIEAAVQQIL